MDSRLLRKASDLSTATAASSSSKRMRKDDPNSEDRISYLPDEMLVLILDKLDARTSVTTLALSKRWFHLPRRLHTFYDLSVDEFLPPRYHRVKERLVEIKAGFEGETENQNLTGYLAVRDRHKQLMARMAPLSRILQRYERCAMRHYIKRVNAFLLAPKDVLQRRSAQKLRIQTFGANRYIDQWITAAIAGCNVEELELILEDLEWHCDFRLLDGLQNARLKRLLLSKCSHRLVFNSFLFHGLKELTLCKIADLSNVSDILSNCVQLEDFRLRHSPFCCYPIFRIDAPVSKLKKLQVDSCKVGKVELLSLPCLEAFACRGQPTHLYYGEVPQLRHVSLDFFHIGDNGEYSSSSSSLTYSLSKFFKGKIQPEYLVLQLKGPKIWIEPTAIANTFSKLRRLFLANVPIYWDMTWIFLLLDAAPALESLHIHIDGRLEKMSAGQDVQVEPDGRLVVIGTSSSPTLKYSFLKELVFIGFNGTRWQTGLVKQIMRASPKLKRVHLLDGHVIEDDEQELGVLQVVPHWRGWHDCKRSEILADIANGLSSQYLDIILE